VALVRDRPSGEGLEVLLMTRPASSSFAPRAEVFPGGSVDPADLDPSWERMAPDLATKSAVAPHLMVTAIRETFEECGILLARDGQGEPCSTETVKQLGALRRPSQAAAATEFLASMRSCGLRPGWEDLQFCAHWVTPEGLPRIFDTRFFLARLPIGQRASSDPNLELDSLRWVDPAAALGEALRGESFILPPTRFVLQQLAVHGSADQAVREIARSKVKRVQPKLAEVTRTRYPGLDVEAIHRERDGGGA
jgi:recombination protein RecT